MSGVRTARHGTNPRLWPTLLGLAGCLLVLAAIVALIIIDPRPRPAECYYSSGRVAVRITGPDCTAVMRFVASDTDRAWGMASPPSGPVYSQLEKGRSVVRIYDQGNAVLAGALADYFQKAQWRPVVPSPAPG